MKNDKTGFTLLEVLIVIVLISMLVVVIFQALDQVRAAEARFDSRRNQEKNIYLLQNWLSGLFKNMSSFYIFNNREETYFFWGRGSSVIFLTKKPLLFPYTVTSFVELRFHKKRLLYREKLFREEKTFTTFDALEKERFYVLLDEVDRAEFSYFALDQRQTRLLWRPEINTDEKDRPPFKVMLSLSYKGQNYRLVFNKLINDEKKELPPDLPKL